MKTLLINAKLWRWIESRDLPSTLNPTSGETSDPGLRQGWRLRQGWGSALLTLLGLASTALAIAQQPFSDLEVKAVFLYNFANFVNWPPASGQGSTQPFRYCVLDDEITPVLQKAIKNETVGGRSLLVQEKVTAANLAECQVLYLAKGRLRGAEIWELVRGAPAVHVLTVSDLEGFETQGGMIALVRQDRRIHPRINIDTVERGKLRISAKLLNLATVVRDSTTGN